MITHHDCLALRVKKSTSFEGRKTKGLKELVKREERAVRENFSLKTPSFRTAPCTGRKKNVSSLSFSPAAYAGRVYSYKKNQLKALDGEARPAPAAGLGVRVVYHLEAGLDQLLLKVDRRALDEAERDRVDREQGAAVRRGRGRGVPASPSPPNALSPLRGPPSSMAKT